MFRVIPEERKRFRHHSYGHFTIETPLNGQNEVLLANSLPSRLGSCPCISGSLELKVVLTALEHVGK